MSTPRDCRVERIDFPVRSEARVEIRRTLGLAEGAAGDCEVERPWR